MHVVPDLNVNWIVQFIISIFVFGLGFVFHRRLLLLPNKNTCSKFSPSSSSSNMVSASCAVCDNFAKKRCSGCKIIRYCSEACQRSHWISEHKTKCNNLKLISKANSTWTRQERKTASTDNIVHHSGKILFPYDEFIGLSDLEIPGFSPCGLLNCGNSCFANVVLQCLTYTKPFVTYLQIQGHKRECRRNDWCFLCEFQTHFERASYSSLPFSPINILSRLPNIGGNLGHGSQEDAHEFMRFAIDTMQSVCLDQYGGEKAVHPRSQETTLIQHIFGGQLQSQVICTKCDNISNQLENMMDLTVEIQGDAASLEECLDQFTVKERLHGENMYKCDRCNEYVTAWKRFSVLLPPNILTIALKRFQTGRFGKLNKRVTFPEKLDLGPYMSDSGVDNEIYKLYGVIVHVDILNASYFGHYICYVKDFCGQWYRIDDCKVARVDVDEVLSQGAYMLLYSRARVRSRCRNPLESNGPEIKKGVEHNEDSRPSVEQSNAECPSVVKEGIDSIGDSDSSAVTTNPLESNGPEIKKGIEHNEDSRPSIEQSNVECPSVVKEGVDSVGDSDSSAVTTNPLESIGPEIMKAIEHNEDSQPSLEQPDVECPSVLSEDPDRVGDSVSSAATMAFSDGRRAFLTNSSEDMTENMDKVDHGATPFVENDFGVEVSVEIAIAPSSDGIAIAPSESSNGLVPSSGDNSLSCKPVEDEAIEKVADTIIISDVKDCTLGGNINSAPSSYGIAIAPSENSNGLVPSSDDNSLSSKSIEEDAIEEVADTILISDVKHYKSEGDRNNGSMKDTPFTLANGKSETSFAKLGYNYGVEENKSGGDSSNGPMEDTSFALANGKSETSSVKPGYIYDVEENKSGGDSSHAPMKDTSFALANGKSETSSVKPGYNYDVEENKLGSESSNGPIKDASFALANGKSETSSVKPCYNCDVEESKSDGDSSDGPMKDTSFALANGKSEKCSVKPGYNCDIEENKSRGDSSDGPMEDTSFALANGKSETSSVRLGYTEHLVSVARKCNGTDASGLKLKPIFSPGFLGKQQQKKGIKKTAGVLSKHQKPASGGMRCSTSNGFTNGNMHTLDHSFTDKQNSWGSPEGLSNNLGRDTDMVDVDVADEEARDLARREPSNRIIDTKMVDVKELVQDKPDHW